MATLTCTPATYSAQRSAAASGDTLILGAGTYTGWAPKSGVTQQAANWAVGMATTGTGGHFGAGFTTIVQQGSYGHSGVTGAIARGLFFDSRAGASLNTCMVQNSTGCWFEDCAIVSRRNDGGRNILFNIKGNPAGANNGVRRCRINSTGKLNDPSDHAFYCADGAWSGTAFTSTPYFTVEQCIVDDGGYFPFQTYPAAQGFRARYNIVNNGFGSVTIAGESVANNPSLSVGGVAQYNEFRNNIFTNHRGTSRYHIEWYDNHDTLDMNNNVVDQCWIGGGQGSNDILAVPGGKSYYTVTNRLGTMATLPGFNNPAGGDFTLQTTSPAYTSSQAAGFQVGPDAIQPGAGGGGGGGGGGTTGFGVGTILWADTFPTDGSLPAVDTGWVTGPWGSDADLQVSASKVQSGLAEGTNANNKTLQAFSVAASPPGGSIIPSAGTTSLDVIFTATRNTSTTGKILWCYLMLAGSGGTMTGYMAQVIANSGTDVFRLVKTNAGTDTVLITETVEWVTGQSVGIRIDRTAGLTLYKTVSGVWTQVGSTALDTTYQSGVLGIATNAATGQVDGVEVRSTAVARRPPLGASMGV